MTEYGKITDRDPSTPPPDALMRDITSHILGFEEEDQFDAFTWLVLNLAEQLGDAWGFGHLGNRPSAWARWALCGQEVWPELPEDAGGAPSLWRDLKIKYDMKYREELAE